VINEGPEYRDCQRPAFELLRDHFGYHYADGRSDKFTIERESAVGGDTEPLLLQRLDKALRVINPGVTDKASSRRWRHCGSQQQQH